MFLSPEGLTAEEIEYVQATSQRCTEVFDAYLSSADNNSPQANIRDAYLAAAYHGVTLHCSALNASQVSPALQNKMGEIVQFYRDEAKAMEPIDSCGWTAIHDFDAYRNRRYDALI
ncbi:MAG: hypothetical protein KJP02_05685 [Octadecabacter sp.]|nr:hypothetical protein [Octadecabacter sp.]